MELLCFRVCGKSFEVEAFKELEDIKSGKADK